MAFYIYTRRIFTNIVLFIKCKLWIIQIDIYFEKKILTYSKAVK